MSLPNDFDDSHVYRPVSLSAIFRETASVTAHATIWRSYLALQYNSHTAWCFFMSCYAAFLAKFAAFTRFLPLLLHINRQYKKSFAST